MLELIPVRERRDLLIAWSAISLAFAVMCLRNDFFASGTVDPLGFLQILLISFATVGVGLVLHELAHKFTAIKYGYWAEFRKNNQMLLVAVVLAALAGVVFAAPGATVIYSNTPLSREIEGRISAAGPVTNLLLCLPFFALTLFTGGAGILGGIGVLGLQVNAMIAAFNLLPVSVLDGRKIYAWNPLIFGVLFVAAFAVLIGSLSI